MLSSYGINMKSINSRMHNNIDISVAKVEFTFGTSVQNNEYHCTCTVQLAILKREDVSKHHHHLLQNVDPEQQIQ